MSQLDAYSFELGKEMRMRGGDTNGSALVGVGQRLIHDRAASHTHRIGVG